MKRFSKYRDYEFNDGWRCRVYENPQTRKFDYAPGGTEPLGHYIKRHKGVKRKTEGIIFF